MTEPAPRPADPGAGALTELLRRQRRRLVAHLARDLGLAHLALAEDAVQAASLRALERWPQDGRPDHPGAWLYRVARHHAIDQLRRDGRSLPLPGAEDDDEAMPTPVALTVEPAPGRLGGELDDDELALLFAACQPRLPGSTQVALGLRALAGLELAALAEGLFTTPAALAQRLARARSLLQGEALSLPAGPELPPRRDAVFTALGLMFHAGQQAAARAGRRGDAAQDPLQPCWEAIRLARALTAHPVTACAEADALAACLLLHGARLTGRLDEGGDIVLLPGQPRDRWDTGLIALGLQHLQRSQRAHLLSRWHLLAGIAAEHALAPSYEATDWSAIVHYYEQLLQIDPSAAPRLAHAIALAEGGAAADALARLQALEPGVPEALRPHACAAIARAHERLGRDDDARHWLDRAIACARHPADARVLQRRREAIGHSR